MICAFECTFCRCCVEERLANVCPNCGGGFSPRPVRPATHWKGGNYLGRHPASEVIRSDVDRLVEATAAFGREILEEAEPGAEGSPPAPG